MPDRGTSWREGQIEPAHRAEDRMLVALDPGPYLRIDQRQTSDFMALRKITFRSVLLRP